MTHQTRAQAERMAFMTGYHDGRNWLVSPESAREALAKYPDFTAGQIEAYLNGCDDGRRGDTFRLAGL